MKPDDLPTSARGSSGGLDGESPVAGTHPVQIGPYRVLSVLGEGGMGVVYLAEQTEPVRREVALKILKPGMDTRQVVARFESERQSLAVMEHPGIAKVYDAGATEAGRPYFAMERVNGEPITEYCDARRLGVRERVRLFAQVCRAVQHAHQKGVIHRDLKPSNVMVTLADERPLCKIIDFGIAKAVGKTLEEQTRLTQLDQSVGTPAYMSPEQVEAGHDVDTRSDIYSLGVLLYELLAGVLPFEPQAYRGWAFYTQHLVREPPVPSARFTGLDVATQAGIAELRRSEPAALRRQLRGELDWVTMRALEKDRERRYETANGFALDLERFLANEPVAASPPSRAYRTRKFVRRNRVGVAFAAVLAVLLLGFAVAMGVQAERVARARDLAVVRQGQAEDLIGFMLGDLRAKLTPVGRLDILDDVGAHAMAYFAAVPEGELSDEELFRRAEAIRQLGEVRAEQGDLGTAMQAFHEAFGLAQRLAGRDPGNGRWQLGLSTSRYWIGYVHFRQGQFDSALAEWREYQRIAERLVAAAPDSMAYQLHLSYGYGNVGSALEMKGELEAALEAFRSSLAVKQVLAEREPDNAEFQDAEATSHNKVAVLQYKLGNLDSALQNHRAELSIRQALVAQDSTNAQRLRDLALAHEWLGNVLLARGAAGEALQQYRLGHAIHTRLAARDAANAGWQLGLAISDRLIARALLGQNQAEQGLPYLDASRKRLEDLLSRDTANARWKRHLASTLTLMGKSLIAIGENQRALVVERQALEILRPQLGRTPESPELGRSESEVRLALGSALEHLGREGEATDEWSRALAAIEPVARVSGETNLLALWAEALLVLDRRDAARPIVEELDRRGYRHPEFLQLVRRKEVIP